MYTVSIYIYHLKSRWRNSHVLVYHGPLLSQLLGVASHLLWLRCMYLFWNTFFSTHTQRIVKPYATSQLNYFIVTLKIWTPEVSITWVTFHQSGHHLFNEITWDSDSYSAPSSLTGTHNSLHEVYGKVLELLTHNYSHLPPSYFRNPSFCNMLSVHVPAWGHHSSLSMPGHWSGFRSMMPSEQPVQYTSIKDMGYGHVDLHHRIRVTKFSQSSYDRTI